VSTATITFTLMGLSSVFAQATAGAVGTEVEVTVESCVATISPAGPVDMGLPEVTGGEYFFFADPFDVDWSLGSSYADCPGALYASRTEFTEVDNPGMTLDEMTTVVSLTDTYGSLDTFVVPLSPSSPIKIADSSDTGEGDSATFDMEVKISTAANIGTYRSTITFEVLPAPPE